MWLYRDRRHAGRLLVPLLTDLAGRSDVVVLALPRGGVPVAYEVARALEAPLDVFPVRKLGAPFNEEYGVGALARDGVARFDRAALASLGLTERDMAPVVERERRELARREELYRHGRPFPALTGKVVVVVDDGLATGVTMLAALRALRDHRPAVLVAAVPVASREACEALQRVADRVVCGERPQPFFGVGTWYHDFSQTSDEEVLALLDERQVVATGA